MMNRMPAGRELSEKVPDEIFQLVENFRKFIREQKAYRDQKFDVDPILEVDREAEEFMLAFQRVSVDSDTNAKLIQQIKNDTTKLLRHAELAYSLLRPYMANNPTIQQQQQQQQQNQQQHQQQQQQQQQSQLSHSLFSTSFGTLNNQTTQSPFTQAPNPMTPSNQTFNITTNNAYQTADSSLYLSGGLRSINQTRMDVSHFNHTNGHHNQFANTCSSQYFAELADQFESRMKAYGEQIKELKMSLDSVIKTYNADELFKWLKKQHETLGEIAARVYMTHERIMEKKSELDRSSTNIAANNQTKTNNFN